ncbi:hypothetical protein C8Q76DRAFT_8681 [Earliella scabrosa]|nr:hypothetical protein C8Q76DRAFT_8681 [Earliella scabrosa]
MSLPGGTVEASRAKRIERQQARYRDRGGIFKPAEHNPLLDLLLARGVNGESPSRATSLRRSRSRSTSPIRPRPQQSVPEASKSSGSVAPLKKQIKRRKSQAVGRKGKEAGIDVVGEEAPAAGPSKPKESDTSKKAKAARTQVQSGAWYLHLALEQTQLNHPLNSEPPAKGTHVLVSIKHFPRLHMLHY